MLEFILELLFGNPFGLAPESVLAIGPLAIAAISSAISAGAGILSSTQNKRTRVDIPPELRENIDDLSDPNFFLPALQRSVNTDQGAFNVRSNLTAQGIDSPKLVSERLEAMENDRQDAIIQGLDRLEGLRLSALNQSLGQLSNLNRTNAQLRQQQINNRLGIISQTASGIGSSLVQGMGAKIRQQNFNRFMNQMGSGPTGQTGGRGFDITDQFDVGNSGDDLFGGFDLGSTGPFS